MSISEDSFVLDFSGFNVFNRKGLDRNNVFDSTDAVVSTSHTAGVKMEEFASHN
jgi:hypothetical protein